MSVETRGVDTIPEGERTGRPRDTFNALVGNNISFSVVIFGWLPVSFGLGFWDSLTAMVAGTLLGTLLVAPLSLVSLRTATNLSTSSGAQFGVRGRLIGSGIGLLLSLGYAGIGLWTGGDAVVGVLHRLVGTPANGLTYALVYAILAVPTCLVAIYGFKVVVGLGRLLTIVLPILLVLGVVAYAGHFQTRAVTNYAMGDRWHTWLLAFVIGGFSGPVSYVSLLGDYSRYTPAATSRIRMFLATALGVIVSLLIPQTFGIFTALATRGATDYVGPLVGGTPTWYLVPLFVMAVLSTMGNGMLLYSMGLDLDAILPKWSRTASTCLVSAGTIALVYIGHFLWNAQSFITGLVVVLTATGVPWAVITLLGFARCRGQYDAEALQVFNKRTRGGIYWYVGGWSVQATTAWAVASLVGLFAVDGGSTLYTGPLVAWTGGIDMSILLSGSVAVILYLALTWRNRQGVLPSEPAIHSQAVTA